MLNVNENSSYFFKPKFSSRSTAGREMLTYAITICLTLGLVSNK